MQNDRDLLLKLAESSARVEEAIKGLRRDFEFLRGDVDDEKGHAHESRKDVHVKLDALTERTSEVESTLRIVGQVSAQTRDVVAAQVMPVVAEFNAMKWRGAGMLSAAAVAGSVLLWLLATFGVKILAKFGIVF
jgi:hypothetical protein